jgi:methylenetetrahydrofolate reductase (NADPH)
MHEVVPGVRLPQSILDRFEDSSEDDYEELGVEIALDLIQKIKAKPGINGIHLMAVGWEAIVPRVIREAGLSENDRVS